MGNQRTQPLFDPLRFLTMELDAQVRKGPHEAEEPIILLFQRGTPAHKRTLGRMIAKRFERLLLMQLATTPPRSVQKMIAHGDLKIRKGHFVLP